MNTYEQELSKLKQAEIMANMEYLREEMKLKDKAFYSKNQMDSVIRKLIFCTIAGFVFGCIFWRIISHL